jgi:ribosomal protein S18 acetylase RimI-like enzyme
MPDSSLFRQTEIRPAFPGDAEAIRELHLASIRRLCASHYSPDQIEQWTRGQPLEVYAQMIQGCLMVAEYQGAIVGMAQMNADTGLIQVLHVHPDYARRKIGTDLLGYLHSMAYGARLPRMTVVAPANAIEFFRANDFTEIGPDLIELPDGTQLPGLKMEQLVYRVLTFAPDQTIRERLLAALACDNRLCMLATLRQLREQKPQELLDEIILLLRHPDQKTRRRAGVALGTFSKLKEGEPTVEQKAAEVADYLVNGPDESVRLCCAIHLMPVHHEIVDRAFLAALNDSDDKIVEIACTEVGYRCQVAGGEALVGVLRHPLWRIRLAAAIALINQNQADERVVAALEAMKQQPEAAAYDIEMAEMKESLASMPEAFLPEGEAGEIWRPFDSILAKARGLALKLKFEVPNPKLPPPSIAPSAEE